MVEVGCGQRGVVWLLHFDAAHALVPRGRDLLDEFGLEDDLFICHITRFCILDQTWYYKRYCKYDYHEITYHLHALQSAC